MLSFGDVFPVLFQGGEKTGEWSCSNGATGRFYTTFSKAMVEEERNIENFSCTVIHLNVQDTVHITDKCYRVCSSWLGDLLLNRLCRKLKIMYVWSFGIAHGRINKRRGQVSCYTCKNICWLNVQPLHSAHYFIMAAVSKTCTKMLLV